jgi:hypothetical protein
MSNCGTSGNKTQDYPFFVMCVATTLVPKIVIFKIYQTKAEILMFYITCTWYEIFYYFSLDIGSRKFRPEIL